MTSERRKRAPMRRVAAVVAMAAIAGLMTLVRGGPGEADPMGAWGPVLDWGLQGKHMAMLTTGKALVWSTGANARVWDPVSGAFTDAPATFGDLHCAGNAALADGRVIVLGGQNGSPHIGTKVTALFDPVSQTWTAGAPMAYERWYASVTTLPDGRVLSTSGDDANGDRITTPEVYDPVANTWTKLTGAVRNQALYPQMYVLPNGKVFEAAPASSTALLDPAGNGSWTAGPTNAWSTNGYSESSAMYEPGKILRAGGGDPAIARTAIIDMNVASPAFTETSPMAYPRRRMNLVVLANGELLAVGGTARGDDEGQAVLPAEIWNPQTKTWRTVGAMAEARMYHSSAVLLTDGRVLVAGGEASGRLHAQIYSPPYLSAGARPTITSAPATAAFGSTIPIATSDAASISSVALIRLNAATHAWDQNQRYVPLTFTQGGPGLVATAPANGWIAPPGAYQLVIKNASGVPSVGSVIRIDNAGALLPGSMSGTVTNSSSGLGVAGATVSVPGGGSAVTAGDGTYALADVAAGEHVVTASAPGLATGNQTVIVPAGQNVVADFALSPPGTVTGTITAATGGLPVPDATITYPGGTANTDAVGHFTIDGVPAGPLDLAVTAIGYDSQQRTVTVAANDTVQADFSLTSAATFVTGGVNDRTSGQPLAGATVTIPGVGSATTDSQGAYRIDVPPGTYTVNVTAPGHQPATASAIVTAGTYAVVDFDLDATASPASRLKEATFENGNLTHATSGVDKISGAVTLASTGALAGGYSAKVNADSAFLEETVPATNNLYFACLLRMDGLPSADARVVQVQNNGTTVGQIQLRPSGKLRLRMDSTTVGVESAALAVGQTYRIGLRQSAGTGANAVLEAFVAPAGPSFGAPFAAMSNGTWTAPATKVRVGATNGNPVNATFDDLFLDSAAMPGGGGGSPPTSSSTTSSSSSSSTTSSTTTTTTAPAPTASFTAAPRSGTAPLPVTFSDTSTGAPTAWAWTFGDGGTSTSRNPSHTYTAPGTYTVSLMATNGTGSNTATQTAFITATAPSSTVTLNPVADAQVKSTSPTTNYGALDTVRLRLGNSSSPGDYRSFLRFDVSGLTGPVASAKLRLYVTEPSSVGGQAFRADPGWTEGALNWNNQPAMPGTALSTLGSVAKNTWVELDVTAAVAGNGPVNLGLRTTSQSSVIYSSREGANKPQLVITQS